MQFVVFDIDGTLIESQALDGALYVRSLAAVFAIHTPRSDWSSYRHTTDAGILEEAVEEHLGRAPVPAERERFRVHFTAALADGARREGFREIAGARRLLAGLAARADLRIGFATGAYGAAARLKMASAGLDFDAHPGACCDDAIARTAIMERAIERLCRAAAVAAPAGVVYVGDGIWDARACAALGLPFIGRATGAEAGRLRAAGARAVLADFSDPGAFDAALEAARHPQ